MTQKGPNARLLRLSEQQLIECSTGWGNNHGCEGGLPANAFEYIKGVGGISTEFSYPYKGVDGKCHFEPSQSQGDFEPHSAGVGGIAPGLEKKQTIHFNSTLMGSLAKGFLRKVCGNSAESSRKFAENTFYCVRKGCGNSAESCGNFAENCGNFSAMTPSRATP